MRKATPVLFLVIISTLVAALPGCGGDDDPTPPTVTCEIEVTAPAAGIDVRGGGDSNPGEWVDIRWTQNGTPSTVDIVLVKGAEENLIAGGEANDGFYAWRARTFGLPTGDDYAIEVRGSADCRDASGLFTIVNQANCGITFDYSETNPIPTLAVGDVFTLEWNSIDTSGDLQLELWTTSPQNFIPQLPSYVIDYAVPDIGTYDWTVSSFNFSASAIYRLLLRDPALETCAIEFTHYFRIVDDEYCSMVLAIPNQDTFDPGEVMRIDIVVSNLTGSVDLELMAGDVVPGSIATGVDPTEPYFWNVEDFGYTGSNRYRIRVTSVEDPYCEETSTDFSISRDP